MHIETPQIDLNSSVPVVYDPSVPAEYDLSKFTEEIKGIIVNSPIYRYISTEGFDEWLINFIHDEVGIPKYILRFVILPLLHKLKDGAYKLASDKIKEFFGNRIRRLVDTLLKNKNTRDKLLKAVHALAKKAPPNTFSKNITAGIRLTEIQDEIAQLRQWAEKENLEAASIIDQLSRVIATQMERKHASLISYKYKIEYQSTDEPYSLDYSLDDIKWLRPEAPNGIPFICPEDKMKKLEEFANDDRQFSAWVISGPSGSGKTRLAIEWMKRNWQRWWCGFTAQIPQEWENWAPVADTFIVVDYFNISHQVVQLIINRMMSLDSGNGQCDFKVRLLILDHNFQPQPGKRLLETSVQFRITEGEIQRGIVVRKKPH